MAEPFLSEIRIMSSNQALNVSDTLVVAPPMGWAFCNGQLLPINQNQALFSLLGTTYGGNGQTTFALPNLQGRVPMHMGRGHTLGEAGGQETHTLTSAEMPTHNHTLNAVDTAGTLLTPANNLLAQDAVATPYVDANSDLAAMAATSIVGTGGSQPHANQQPFLTLNFCIALQGIFPSQN